MITKCLLSPERVVESGACVIELLRFSVLSKTLPPNNKAICQFLFWVTLLLLLTHGVACVRGGKLRRSSRVSLRLRYPVRRTSVAAQDGARMSYMILMWWSVQVLNLTDAADATHAWYHQHFKAYPASRKALIPFIL